MPLFQPNLFQTGPAGPSSSPTDLAAIMDALAAATPVDATTRVYAHPIGSVIPPAIIVGYPTDIEYDATFGRSSDRLVIPVYFVCGAVDDAAARDEISGVVGGANEIKTAIEEDPTVLAVCQTARVTAGTPVSFLVGAITMIAVRFDVEVYT